MRTSRIVVPHQVSWERRLAAVVIFGLIRLVASTVRFRWHDQSGLLDTPTPEPVIYCIWHNRLALSLECYRRFVLPRQPTRRMAGLVSASRDGGFLARILELFGVQPVRGSTSRRGPQALLELTTWAERGYDLAITPDGPRGPRYVIQDGVIVLAQLTGLPILPAVIFLSWKVCLRSWDRFQVPLPFARCEVTFGAPLRVPRETSESQREQLRQHLQERMRAMTQD